MGPPKDTVPWRCVYAGFGVSWPVKEKERASSTELSNMRPMPPLYNDRGPRRLLPKAFAREKGELAPLFTVPLIRKPSTAFWLRSLGVSDSGVSAAGAVEVGCGADSFK